MGAPQVPSKNIYSVGATATIPDGSAAVGGKFVIIDYLIGDFTTGGTAGNCVLTLNAGGSAILTARLNITTTSGGTISLLFPTGFPVVDSSGGALATITATATVPAGASYNLTVGYHNRMFNG